MRAEHRAAVRAAVASSVAAVAAAGFVALARAGFCVHQLLGLPRPPAANAMDGMAMPGMPMPSAHTTAPPDACPLILAAALAFVIVWLVATLVLARRVVAVVAAAARFVARTADGIRLPRRYVRTVPARPVAALGRGTRAPPLPA